MKPVNTKSNTYINSSKEINDEDPKCIIPHIAIRTFLQKAMFQIDLEKFLLSQNLKILFHGDMLLVILKAKTLLECFTKKNCKHQQSSLKQYQQRD